MVGLIRSMYQWMSSCCVENDRISQLADDRKNQHCINSNHERLTGSMLVKDEDCMVCLNNLKEVDAHQEGIVSPFECAHQLCLDCFRAMREHHIIQCGVCRAPSLLDKPSRVSEFLSSVHSSLETEAYRRFDPDISRAHTPLGHHHRHYRF